MNETQTLSETLAELKQGNAWTAKLLGQPMTFETFDFTKAFDTIPRTEVVTADAIADRFKDRLTYVHESKTWYLWNGKIHQPQHADATAIKIVQAYWEVLRDALAFASKALDVLAKQEADDSKRVKYLRSELAKHKTFRDRVASDSTQRAIVNQMRTKLDVPADRYSDDRRWFVVRNGVFDMEEVRAIKSFVLKPHDPARPVYRMWDIESVPGSDFPSMRKFMTTSIEDRPQAEFFMKAVALACMGAPVSTRTIVSLQGAPRTGKSMINRAISRLTGDNGIYAEPPRDAIVKNARNPHHARFVMRQARYVAFTEITDRLDREFVLKYTGGDSFPVEQKYVAGTQVKPQGIIFMASNHGMDIGTTDAAIYERVAPINFPRTFEEVTTDGTHILDPDLEDKIVAEGSGFLEWMKRGYLDYLEHGLDRPDSMEALKRAEREDEVSVSQYIKDRVESGFLYLNPNAKPAECAPVTGLFADYVQWCDGYRVPKDDRLSRKDFGKELERSNPKVTYQTVRFSGIVLSRV